MASLDRRGLNMYEGGKGMGGGGGGGGGGVFSLYQIQPSPHHI